MAASGMMAGGRPATGTSAAAGTSLEKRLAGSRSESRPASASGLEWEKGFPVVL